MGNYRSGRRIFLGAKTTVEQCFAIDIERWSREGLTCPEAVRFGTCEWCSPSGKVVARVGYCVNMTDPQVRLQYRNGEDQRLDYRVKLVSTRPHYGGLRWWFICPIAVGGRACRRRVRKLYLPPGGIHFGCRHCWKLSYTSQREDAMNRALSKVQAIRERLGGSASIVKPFPAKPKRMQWKTYRRLQAKSEELWVACLRAGLGLPPD